MEDVIRWLMDADPAVAWQTMRDLLDSPPDAVAEMRARVTTEGWGPRILGLQAQDGRWGGGTYLPEGKGTLNTLVLLVSIGIDPRNAAVGAAIERIRERVLWEHAGERFFDGEVEPCINGRIVATGVFFGVDVRPIVERLLTEQMEDGGWNCEQENGSVRGSFDTTINVLEGLLVYERVLGADARITTARERAHEYLLVRGLMRRLSTGTIVSQEYSWFRHPAAWRYDVLRALDYLRDAGVRPDPRMTEAIGVVRRKRRPDGKWALEGRSDDELHFPMSEGGASYWNTLRALRVLRWYESA